MAQRALSAAFLAVLIGLLSLIGCAKKSEVQVVPVSGTVSLGGQPFMEGFLYIKTIETGNLERFDIQYGEFKGSAQVGTRRVEIFSNHCKTVVIDGANVEVPENILHPSCNTATKLTAEVSSEGPNRFHFDVQKK